jgi:hypothetical protein
MDSSNKLGYVPEKNIEGKATIIFWNEHTGKLSNTPIE